MGETTKNTNFPYIGISERVHSEFFDKAVGIAGYVAKEESKHYNEGHFWHFKFERLLRMMRDAPQRVIPAFFSHSKFGPNLATAMWKDGCGWNHRRRTTFFWFRIKCLFLVVLAYLAVVRICDVMNSPKETEVPLDTARRQLALPSRVGRILNSAVNGTEARDPIAVLIFCATRAAAIENHLSQVVKQRPSPDLFPIYVSQDGNKQDVAEVVRKYMRDFKNIHSIVVKKPRFLHSAIS
uniref:Alpha-1,3-mannosyl-glycoprotein 2-beta-N-acetylglucosaminyltransferase n=1 Tax=Bursaphelenchus xylophilus TaxID=6326 RepID=A0A1I7RWK4_BURXY